MSLEVQKAVDAERHRVEDLETTASEFAHRISTPLQPITLHIQQLLEKDVPLLRSSGCVPETVESIVKRINSIGRNTRNIRDVTSHLRAITRPWHPQKSTFAVGAVLRACTAEIADELKERFIELRIVMDPQEGPQLYADEEQVGYCIQCLLRNAVESIDERRRQTRDPDYDPRKSGDQVQVNASSDASGSVSLSVIDTGTGVDDSIARNLFEPLFSTKRRIDPSGMGLFGVRRIMTLHGGTVEFGNQRPRGARFTLYFPGIRHDL
jgi:two-component system sensor histidine kinase HydH